MGERGWGGTPGKMPGQGLHAARAGCRKRGGGPPSPGLGRPKSRGGGTGIGRRVGLGGGGGKNRRGQFFLMKIPNRQCG